MAKNLLAGVTRAELDDMTDDELVDLFAPLAPSESWARTVVMSVLLAAWFYAEQQKRECYRRCFIFVEEVLDKVQVKPVEGYLRPVIYHVLGLGLIMGAQQKMTKMNDYTPGWRFTSLVTAVQICFEVMRLWGKESVVSEELQKHFKGLLGSERANEADLEIWRGPMAPHPFLSLLAAWSTTTAFNSVGFLIYPIHVALYLLLHQFLPDFIYLRTLVVSAACAGLVGIHTPSDTEWAVVQYIVASYSMIWSLENYWLDRVIVAKSMRILYEPVEEAPSENVQSILIQEVANNKPLTPFASRTPSEDMKPISIQETNPCLHQPDASISS